MKITTTFDATCDLIRDSFGVEESRARELARDILSQIESHGGNPENWEEVKISVDVVVRNWVSKERKS